MAAGDPYLSNSTVWEGRSPITVAKWPLIDSLLEPADHEIILLGALQEGP